MIVLHSYGKILDLKPFFFLSPPKENFYLLIFFNEQYLTIYSNCLLGQKVYFIKCKHCSIWHCNSLLGT